MNKFEPSIRTLHLILKIVQTGKLTSAATELHMSQSAASHALRSLESQLGVQLFVREHDGLRLSDVGQRLRQPIEAALSALETIRAETANSVQLKAGTVRVAAVSSLLSTILPPILGEYTRRYPGVELSTFEGTDDEVIAWVKSGTVHVGFAALPTDGVDAEEIARDEWFALVPSDEFARKGSLTLAELASHKFLMSGGGCERHILQIFSSAGITIHSPMMVKQMPTIHAMVGKHLGVSLIPRLSFAGARSCRIIRLQPRMFRRIGMLRSRTCLMSPALEAWLSLVRLSARHFKAPVSSSPRSRKRKV